MNEIKDCQVCGSEALSQEKTIFLPSGRSYMMHIVICAVDKCQCTTLPWDSREEAIAAWNRGACFYES